MPEGTRRRGIRERVETRVSGASRGRQEGEVHAETMVSRVLRVVEECPDEDSSDERRPGMADEPPDEAQVESRGPDSVQVEPGGETESRRNGGVMHGDADAGIDDRAEEAHGDVQFKAERSATCRDESIAGERWSARPHERSTTTDENDQRTSTGVNDVPSPSPEPPPPVLVPYGPAQRRNEPPSVELEGERESVVSCDAGPTACEADVSVMSEGDEDPRNRPKAAQDTLERTRERSKRRTRGYSPGRAQVDPGDQRDEADAPPASRSVEDDGNWLRKLRNTSERERKHSKRKEEQNSPSRPREEREGPGGGTLIPGGVQSNQEGPKGIRNERADETHSPSRDWPPGDHLGDREKSEVVEGGPDRAKVVEGAGYNGKPPESVRNQRDVDMNALCRVRGLGGRIVEEVGPGDVEDDRERRSDGNGDDTDGIRGGMDDATSGVSGESKRLDTRPLAETDSSQHKRRERGMAHVPERSTPPPDHHRRPTDHPNPPRRRGRIKTRSRKISQT